MMRHERVYTRIHLLNKLKQQNSRRSHDTCITDSKDSIINERKELLHNDSETRELSHE